MDINNVPVGVIHGRFQGLHLGHMEYLLEGKKRCDFLWIGITNPDPGLTAFDASNPSRSEKSSNPFTYFERLSMIRDAMLEAGIPRTEFEIVPFPINVPDAVKHYVPLSAKFFVTIYDEWGQRKIEILRNLGITDIDVMWTRTMEERFTSGSEVRKLILKNDKKWETLVPPSVCKAIHRIGLEEIILRMSS